MHYMFEILHTDSNICKNCVNGSIMAIDLVFCRFEMNSNLSNYSKGKLTTSMTLYYLSVIIEFFSKYTKMALLDGILEKE